MCIQIIREYFPLNTPLAKFVTSDNKGKSVKANRLNNFLLHFYITFLFHFHFFLWVLYANFALDYAKNPLTPSYAYLFFL